MPNAQRRAPRTARSIGTRYVLGLTYAQLITAVEVAAVAISLGGQSFGANTALTPPRLAVPVALIAFGVLGTAIGGYWSIARSLRWFPAGVEPDAAQRKHAINLVRRQTAILLGI